MQFEKLFQKFRGGLLSEGAAISSKRVILGIAFRQRTALSHVLDGLT